MDRQNDMRVNYLRDDDFFMSIAYLAAQRSKDPTTQVGACIANKDGVVIGVGHNHMPNDSDEFPWARDSPDIQGNKYLYVCHAGLTAILNKNSADVRGCTMYVTLFPSCESGKVIAQAGIKEIVYLTNKYSEWKETDAARKMLDKAGVTYRQFVPNNGGLINIDFNDIIQNVMN